MRSRQPTAARGGAAEFPPTYPLRRAGNAEFAPSYPLRWAGSARPLALPMGELARLQAVTERVPGSNHRTFLRFATAHALSVSLRSPAPPEWEPRAAAPPDSRRLTLCAGRATLNSRRLTLCAGRAAPNSRRLTLLRWAGSARPLALPMGELARLKAVTERVPSQNPGTIPIYATAHALSVSLRSTAPPEWEPRAAAPPDFHRLTSCAAGAST